MHLEATNLKSILRISLIVAVCAFAKATTAQTPDSLSVTTNQDKAIQAEVLAALASDSVKITGERYLVDGIAGVIGDYVILNSDIVKEEMMISRNSEVRNKLSKCELLDNILQQKMYAHHAVQDSIIVTPEEVTGRTEQQVASFKNDLQTDDTARVAEYYGYEDIEELQSELNEINRSVLLAGRMQSRIVEAVQITPEEAREFFFSIPEEDRPIFNTEVEVAQIVVNAKPDPESVESVKQQLNQWRKEVLENGDSFTTKAILYSDDNAGVNGGKFSLRRTDGFVKEFKDAAFSLQEGEISEPFESIYGWHILIVEKIRGQVRDVRHILKTPRPSIIQMDRAKQKLERMRDSIVLGKISFADAARAISDQEQLAKNGGQLLSPRTGGPRIELTALEPELAAQLQQMKKGDITAVTEERDPIGRPGYKIIYMIDRIGDHKADYTTDFDKIKELALQEKRAKAVEKWQADKLKDTYTKIGSEFEECDFITNWLK